MSQPQQQHSQKKDSSQREREFIYKYQFQRGLNPMYIPFTKAGFFLTAIVAVMTYYGNTGLMFTLTYALLYWVIYKSYFDYKYTEIERLWLFALWNNFIVKRRKKPFVSNTILDWED